MKKTICLLIFLFPFLQSCNHPDERSKHASSKTAAEKLKFSLAQWSFNRELFAGEMTNIDFINTASKMGFEGVEYLNQFFNDKAENFEYLDSLNAAAKSANIKNLLIMIDVDERLGASDIDERNLAVEIHKKWVSAAKYLGCSSVRINAYGDGTPDDIKDACIESISRLAAWSQEEGVQILIENHGGISSKGSWLVDLVKSLQQYEVGILPDFNNWCYARENGEIWGSPCIKTYNRYKGLEELMPYARSLSIKSLDFDDEGNETTMDYPRLIKIIKENKYDGYWGIEFEGNGMPASEGIEKTRALVKKVWNYLDPHYGIKILNYE